MCVSGAAWSAACCWVALPSQPASALPLLCFSSFAAEPAERHPGITAFCLLMPPRPPHLPCRCRCFAQLSLLGYILVPIFLANRWWLTLLYTLFMLVVAAVEAVSRPTQTYNGMLLQASCVWKQPDLLITRNNPAQRRWGWCSWLVGESAPRASAALWAEALLCSAR